MVVQINMRLIVWMINRCTFAVSLTILLLNISLTYTFNRTYHKFSSIEAIPLDLNSQWSPLNWAIFATNVFRDLDHGLVIGQTFRVLQLIQVVHDPVMDIFLIY